MTGPMRWAARKEEWARTTPTCSPLLLHTLTTCRQGAGVGGGQVSGRAEAVAVAALSCRDNPT